MRQKEARSYKTIHYKLNKDGKNLQRHHFGHIQAGETKKKDSTPEFG